ncbi:MAG: type II toxin-antitoxin system VapC family toxin [Bacteroidales bacterium]|nr:type II toxin-antitoxin system VapC family toxin [Bacteroidales bacterium]
MKIFIDTSSLIKLYHFEQGTEDIDKLFKEHIIDEIFLSEIIKIEFSSAIWKKVRTKDLTESEAKELIEIFKLDFDKFTFIDIDKELIKKSIELLSKYGLEGLRTLDSLQLASILRVKEFVSIGKTNDDLLKKFFEKEGIKTENA